MREDLLSSSLALRIYFYAFDIFRPSSLRDSLSLNLE